MPDRGRNAAPAESSGHSITAANRSKNRQPQRQESMREGTGGGAAAATAWELGALAALAEAGVDPALADLLPGQSRYSRVALADAEYATTSSATCRLVWGW